ncbi:MAG: hypothetical protein ACIAXF_04785 [Phycisphaerales bacterium JB063]
MRRQNRWRAMAFLALSVWCVSAALSAAAQDTPGNAEPDPRHRIGHYEIEEPGIPYRIIYETRVRYGWEPRDDDTETYRRSPDQPTNDSTRNNTDWFIETPDTYRADRPAGLLIFIKSGLQRRCPDEWKQSLVDHNLIYVGFPAGSANRPWFAHARAVYGVQLLAQRYNLDPRRIYLVGMDNGATVVNAASVLTPDYFRAAFILYGSAFPADLNFRGDDMPGFAPNADRRALRNAAQRSTLVYFNGEDDIEREIMLFPANAYDRAGFNVTVIDRPEHGTETLPGPEYLAAAVNAFEHPFHRNARRDYQRGIRLAERDKRGEALPMLLDALSIGSTADFADDARAKLTELQDAYAAELAVIEQHLAADELDQAAQALSEFERVWGDFAEPDCERLEATLDEARRAQRNRE